MTDNNKVVIKINIKDSDKRIKKNSQSKMVTEWHFQRIMIAMIMLVIVILIPFYFFSDEPSVSKSGTSLQKKQIMERIADGNEYHSWN